MNVLSLVWRERPSAQFIVRQPKGRLNFPWRREAYLDFVVDSHPLKELIDAQDGYHDQVGVLGNGFLPEAQTHWRSILLSEKASELETGRIELYVCANCGDIGCGSITVGMTVDERQVTWKDFGNERNYEIDEGDGLVYKEGLENIGPFTFDRQQYREALLSFPPEENA